ncbi:MAG: hypothetical protein ACRYHQ_35665 [Janthinobacterium lividum]
MAAGYSVQITAVDKATATLNKVNAALAGTLAPVNRLGGALAKLGDTTGVNRLGSGLANLERQAVRTAEGMARIVPAMGAITGAASLAGLSRLASQWADFGDKLGFTSQRIGISTQQLQGLQGAARLAGSSSEAMTGGLRGLQQTLQDAVGGRNRDAVVMFGKLGISFQDAGRNARGVTDVLPELADKIAGIKNPQLQAMIATQMFGGAAEDLLPLLRQGSAGLRRLTEEAGRYGLMTDKGRETARDFAAAQTRIGLAVEGLGGKVAEKLVPVLVPLLDRLAGWITSHGDNIAAFFGRVGDSLTRWVDNGGVQDMLAKLESFGAKVDSVVHAFGGWEVAATALGVVLGAKLLSPLTGIVTAMGALGGMKPSPWMLKMLGVGGGAVGLAMDLSGGKTVEDQRAFNTDSAIARFGEALGEKLGMKFDADGKSEGLLGRWAGSGRGAGPGTGSGYAGMTPGEAARGGRPQGSPTTRTFDTSLTPQARGLLDTIAGTESPGYNVMYGGRRFMNMSEHPNTPVPITSGPNAGQTSTAAGRYQFLKSTWDEASSAAGVHDFTPGSQDKAAWWLAQRDYNQRTGRDLAGDLQSSDPRIKAGIGQALHSTWTSLPGGIEAGTNDSRFTRQLDAAVARNQPGPPVAGPASPGIQQAAPAVAGRVAVDVTHRGDPGNTNVRVTASGAAEQDRLRIERAPLLMGIP